MQTSFCFPQKKWRTPHAKTEHHPLRSAAFHLSASWADVLGLLLTAQIFRASRYGGKPYGKQNALFWARRASGLAILLMLFFHIGVFGKVQNGVYILFPFTTVRLLTQLLLVASVFVHLLLNLRPLLVSLGIVRDKEQRGDLYLILSILVLFAAGSIILYYIGWNNV